MLLASSEYRHALETDIEPYRGLLLGLFFISVGMAIDFGLPQSRPGMVALLVLGFDRFRARDMANIFRRHNINVTEAMIPHFDDDDRLVSAAKGGAR